MSTSAPMRREFDIPIVEPFRAPVLPRELPVADPKRWVTVTPVPVVQPVRQPVRVEV